MPEKAEPKSNYDRLLTHLEDGSLAYQLVQAHCDHDTTDPTESMMTVLRERLGQARRSIDGPEA